MILDLVDWPVYGCQTKEQFEYSQYQNRRVSNVRFHCNTCGKFVPKASIRALWNWEHTECEYMGTCKIHGRVDVSWGEEF